MNWTSEEVRIYEAQNTGAPWRYLTEKEKIISANGILYKIAVISGCQLPGNGMVSNSLEEELIINLESDKKYSSLTVEEILTAFRMNAAGKLGEKIKHYNLVFNIDYFFNVINQYLEFRADVRIKAEQETQKHLEYPTTNQKIQWEEICENCYQEYLTDNYNFLTWPAEIYQSCVDGGYISDDLFNDFKERARIVLTHPQHENFLKEPDIGNVFNRIISELRKDENQDVINVAKKLAVKYLFKKASESKFEKLFIQS